VAVSPETVPDCLFYGDSVSGAWSQLIVDDSGEDTDLTNGTTYGSESNSTRANQTSTRTVNMHVDTVDDTEAGYIWSWDRGGGDYSALYFDGSGNVVFTVDGGTTTYSFDPAGLTGTAEEFLITWAMQPNKDTTGAFNTRRSEIRVWNLTNGTYENFVQTHPAETGTDTGTMYFGNSPTLTDTIAGDVLEIRLSAAFQTATETYETFVAQSSAPTLIGQDFRPAVMPPRSQVTLGDDGEFAGPVHSIGS